MASGSRGRGEGSAGAGAGALDTLANPDLAHLPAVDLVVHLHREGRSGSDFADVALVLAVRERRLAEAEARVRAAEVVADGLRDTIRAADVVADGLRDTIRALELKVANAEALACHPTVVAGEDDESSEAGDHLTAGDIGIGAAAAVTGGEIRARGLETVVPDLPAGEITPGVCFEAGVEATPDEVGDNMASPIPLMRIDASPVAADAPELPDELIEERAVEGVVVDDVAVPRNHEVAEAGLVDCRDKVSEAITRKRKEPPTRLDGRRVKGHKVLEEVAHREDIAAHRHRRSQGEQPARATKKARRQKGPSFHTMVFNALVQKQKLLEKKQKEEALAKKATVVASQPIIYCNCWSNAPYLPSKTSAVEDNFYHKVLEEEAHGEDVAERPHRHSQGEQPARATKKAQMQKAPSFRTMVFNALMEKQKLLMKKEEEAFAKKTVVTASKQMYCSCWSNAPYLPSKTVAAEDNSHDGKSSQN